MAIAFSKLCSSMNQSATSLHGRVPFAVSFPDKSSLRVINPPLHSTPAILQALRSAWPRGTSSENKIDTSSYEFKLKGYSILKEDTFPRDSLIHILNILSSLDEAGFTLLASLSVTGVRHRIKDLWIFAGKDHPSPPASAHDATSSQTTRRAMPTPIVVADHQTAGLWNQFATHLEEDKQPFASQETNINDPRGVVNGHMREASSKVPKHAVLKKKQHVQETSQARSDDDQVDGGELVEPPPTDMTGIGAGQFDSSSKHSEVPARIIYSTPRPQPNVNEPNADHDLVSLENAATATQKHEDTKVVAGLAGAALITGAAVSQDEDRSKHKELDGPIAEPLQGSSPTALKGNPTGRESSADDPSDELLSAGIFRDTGHSSSPEHQHSTSSVPQAEITMPHPLVPLQGEGPTDNITTEGELFPTSPVKRPAGMKRQDTPIVPGGWLSTPAEEKIPADMEKGRPLPTPDIQIVPNHKPQASEGDGIRVSNVGILGSTHPTEYSPDVPAAYNLKGEGATNLFGEREMSSPKKVLEQEEAKVPPVIDDREKEVAKASDHEEPSSISGGSEYDRAEELPPGDKTVTPKRSVFKKIFHRHGRGPSESQDEAKRSGST